jgi:TolB-like protein
MERALNLFGELKRRNVFRVGIAYLVGAWLLVQAADLVLDVIGAPDVVLRSVVVLLILGFIPTVIFAWVYEMTPEGVKKASEIDLDQSITPQTGKKLDFVIVALLVIAIGFLAFDRFLAPPEPDTTVDSVATAQPSTSTTEESTADSALPVTSIAVLPFANRSNQDDDLYFTDGIHDDLLTQLAKIHDLTVISRTSVMEYRNSPKNLTEIASELKVGTILEGGVQKVGNRVRINAQLIEAATDRHLWAETFDRELTAENVFELQSEIARKIVEAIAVQLSPEEERILAQVPTRSLEAYDAYVRGKEIYYGANYARSQEMEAEPYLQRAVELDPNYVEAQVLLASLYGQKYWRGNDTSDELLRTYRDTIELVNRLDPDSPATLRARANYHYRVENDFARSLELLERALEVAPGNVDIHGDIGLTLRRLGRWQESIASFERAMELDPANRFYESILSETIAMTRSWQAVLEHSVPLEDADPDTLDTQIDRAQALFNLTGSLEPMERVFERMNLTLSTNFAQWSTRVHVLQRDYDRALEVLRGPVWAEAESDPGQNGLIYHLQLGQVLQGLGQEEQAGLHFQEVIDRKQDLTPASIVNHATDFLIVSLAMTGLEQFDDALALANRIAEDRSYEADAVQGNLARYVRARIRGLIGDRDGAIEDLKQVLSHPGNPNFTAWDLRFDPNWDFMRDDPRFVELATPDNLIQ